MPKASKARIEANARYRVKAYETVSAQARRSERMNELIEIGAGRAGQSKSAYVLESIRDRLQRDGITADDLPPLPAHNPEP